MFSTVPFCWLRHHFTGFFCSFKPFTAKMHFCAIRCTEKAAGSMRLFLLPQSVSVITIGITTFVQKRRTVCLFRPSLCPRRRCYPATHARHGRGFQSLRRHPDACHRLSDAYAPNVLDRGYASRHGAGHARPLVLDEYCDPGSGVRAFLLNAKGLKKPHCSRSRPSRFAWMVFKAEGYGKPHAVAFRHSMRLVNCSMRSVR